MSPWSLHATVQTAMGTHDTPSRVDGVRPLRLLVVGVSWPLETFVERLVVGLAGAAVDVTLAPLGSFARPPAHWVSSTGVRWTDEAVPRNPRRLLRTALRGSGGALVHAVRPGALARGTARRRGDLVTADFDVVYAPWINSFTDHPELLETDTPLIASCRGSLVKIAPWDPGRTGYRDVLRRVLASMRLVHCVSDDMVADAVALGLDPQKARVIHPAVDPTLYRGTRSPGRPGSVNVLAVGRLQWIKDYEHALMALRVAVDSGADLRLEIVGDGPDRQHLQYVIDDLSLIDRVRLTGSLPHDQVVRRLKGCDIFLHTSCSEGISNAVLEAMASGAPIVTTDAGGMREAVRDGVDGIVVPVRDSTAAGAALVRLAEEDVLRQEMGDSARRRVAEHFALQDQIGDFVDLLREAART